MGGRKKRKRKKLGIGQDVRTKPQSLRNRARVSE
jgi:hypothetical protein